jgi:predicted small secreted protein
MRKVHLLALALTGALLGACNTMEGLGRDVQAAGRGLESMSENARGSISGSSEEARGPNERVSRQ